MPKLIIKSVILVTLTAVVFTLLSPFFIPKWIEGHVENGNTYMTTTTNGFFALEDDSLDVIFIGSSQILRGIDPCLLHDEFGIESYLRATVVQPPQASWYYLKNALKTQRPDVIIADFSALYTVYDFDEREAYVHYSFDTMPLGLNKAVALADIISKSKEQKLLDYLFPTVFYHDRWNEMTEFDKTYPFSKDKSDPNRGSILLDGCIPQEEYVPYEETGAEGEKYSENSLYWYQKMIDTCKDEGIRLIMLRTPRSDWNENRHTSDKALADKNGLEYIDFNLKSNFDGAKLSADEDFYDKNHLTRGGAQKMTRAIGEYLTNK